LSKTFLKMERISPEKEAAIIRLDMQGLTRDEIAAELKIGAGTVSDRLGEWKQELNDPEYEGVKKFVREAKKIGATPKQYASAIRLGNVIQKMGAEEDDVEPLVVSLYSAYDKLKSTDIGAASLLPNQVAKYVIELFEIANKENISISEVSQKLKQEIETTKGKLEELRDAKKKLEEKKKEAEAALKSQLQTNSLTLEKIDELAPINTALARHSLPPEKCAELLSRIQDLERRGYSIIGIAKKITDMETLEQQEQSLKARCEQMKKWLEHHAPLRNTCEEIIDAGFDTIHVRRIKKVIGEIQKIRSCSRKAAIKKFLYDIESYDKKLGLEKQIRKLHDMIELMKKDVKWYDGLNLNSKELFSTLQYAVEKGIMLDYFKHVCDIIVHKYDGDVLLFEKDLENGRKMRERSTMMQERAGAGAMPLGESLSETEARPETMTDTYAVPPEQTVQATKQQEELATSSASEQGKPHVDSETALRAPETEIQEASGSPASHLIAEESFRRPLFLIPNAKFPEVREALDPQREKIGLEFDDDRILAAVIKEIN
jgi:myosin heavy subunit